MDIYSFHFTIILLAGANLFILPNIFQYNGKNRDK